MERKRLDCPSAHSIYGAWKLECLNWFNMNYRYILIKLSKSTLMHRSFMEKIFPLARIPAYVFEIWIHPVGSLASPQINDQRNWRKWEKMIRQSNSYQSDRSGGYESFGEKIPNNE